MWFPAVLDIELTEAEILADLFYPAPAPIPYRRSEPVAVDEGRPVKAAGAAVGDRLGRRAGRSTTCVEGD
jgi:hypothetical protein